MNSEPQPAPEPIPTLRLRVVLAPVLLLLVGFAVTAVLWLAVERGKQERARLEVDVTAAQVRLRLEAWIDARAAVAQHMADIDFADAEEFFTRFSQEALSNLRLYPGIQALNFIDKEWVIRWVIPPIPNAPALNQDLHDHPEPGVRAALSLADSTGAHTRTPIIRLLQGGQGIATYQPVNLDSGQRLGFINTVFRISSLIGNCLSDENLRERFRFVLIESDSVVAYAHPDATDNLDWAGVVDVPVRIIDRPWTLRLALAPDTNQSSLGAPDMFLALLGLLFSLSMALLLYSLLLRQESLRESRAQYRFLVENQNDLVVKVDAQGRLLYASPSYCRTFGKTESELLGRGFMPLVHEDDRESTMRAMGDLKRPPHHCYVEQRAMTRDGWRWLAWSDTAVLGEDGEIAAVIGVGRDITRRRELEDQLLQSQKLQALGQLGGGIAHDFNNILQATRGNLELVLDDESVDPEIRDPLEQAHDSVLKAAGLTRQLLAFSRQQVLEMVTLDLNQVITEHLRLLRRVIDETIALVYEPYHTALYIRADRSQIEQVLLNLCLNARDSIAGAGTVTITTGVRRIDDDASTAPANIRAGEYVVMTITDTGHGIDAANLEHIFDPFFTTKNTGAGTGLGLATVFGVVRQHEGGVTVTSEINQGSTFNVLLPRIEAPKVAARTPRAVTPIGGKETILLTEDNESVRGLATRVLVKHGYHVLTAADGAEGLEVFAANQDAIDLVILDVIMPKLGGHEAAKLMRDRCPEIPLLFTSGYDPGTARAEPNPADDRHFLAKPYSISELLNQIRAILDR